MGTITQLFGAIQIKGFNMIIAWEELERVIKSHHDLKDFTPP